MHFSSSPTSLLEFNTTLSKAASDKIMNDYEKAIEHIRCDIFVKIYLFQQLPLVMVSLCEDDVPLAVTGMKSACSQYDATKENTRHAQLSRTVSGNGPDSLRNEVNTFIESGGQTLSPRLLKLKRSLRVVKSNELSVESLHRQGALFRNKAHNHDAPHLAFGLSSPEVFKEKHFSTMEWANHAEAVQTEFDIVKKWNFDKHPTFQAWKQQQFLDGNALRSGRHGSYAVVGRIFYKCDIASLFQTFPEVDKAFNDRTTTWKQSDSKLDTKPLLKLKDADEDAKLSAVKVRYAMAHLRDRRRNCSLWYSQPVC